jgi:lysophospholipase L1-like esterase
MSKSTYEKLIQQGFNRAQALYKLEEEKTAQVTTKRVTMSLGTPNTFAAAGAVSAWAERYPIHTPVKTTRWRLRVANKHLLHNAPAVDLSQPFTLSDIYMGEAAVAAPSWRFNGSYAAAPQKVLSGGSIPTDGSEWVSEWVTDPQHQFNPDKAKLVGMALTATASGSGGALVAGHHAFRNVAGGANGTVAVQSGAGYSGNSTALDKRIEYEFVGDEKIGLFIGASSEEGYNLVAAGAGYEMIGVYEAWPGVYGMRNRVAWLNAAVSGAVGGAFTNPNAWQYKRFDLETTKPDFAVICMGGNSIISGGITTLTGLQNELGAVITALLSLGINRYYISTILPCGLLDADAKEILRKSYNDWIRTCPLDAVGVLDVDMIIRDPASINNQRAGFVDTDKIHPTLPGHMFLGANVGSFK